jgi:hypothetical protein
MATQYIIILMLLMSVFLFTKEIRERHQISVRQFISFVLFLNLVWYNSLRKREKLCHLFRPISGSVR